MSKTELKPEINFDALSHFRDIIFKNCPCCNSAVTFEQAHEECEYSGGTYIVFDVQDECMFCEKIAEMTVDENREDLEAIAKVWNTRPAEEAQAKRIAELEGYIEHRRKNWNRQAESIREYKKENKEQKQLIRSLKRKTQQTLNKENG